MSNEPVAEKTSNNGWMVSKEYMELPVGTLLYTHPAKTLTDKEIEEVCDTHWGKPSIWNDDDITFARAILRKASEK